MNNQSFLDTFTEVTEIPIYENLSKRKTNFISY